MIIQQSQTSYNIDTNDGIYIAASIYYSEEKTTFRELVDEIDKKYPNTRHVSGDEMIAWRVERQTFAVSVSSDVNDGYLRVIYLKFATTKKELEYSYKSMNKALLYLNKRMVKNDCDKK